MPAMTEAEVYAYLTKDGDSLGAIKKNTEMLRQQFTIESQRVAHTLSQLDPHNKDRHAAEAERIYHENNGTLDRALMQIAASTPQKMPLPVEAINRASAAAKVPKNQAKAVLSFPIILFAAIPAAVFYAIVFIFAVGAIYIIAALVLVYGFKVDMASVTHFFTKPMLLALLKLLLGVCYVVAIVTGYRHLRNGNSLIETFNMLFFESLGNVLSIFSGGK